MQEIPQGKCVSVCVLLKLYLCGKVLGRLIFLLVLAWPSSWKMLKTGRLWVRDRERDKVSHKHNVTLWVIRWVYCIWIKTTHSLLWVSEWIWRKQHIPGWSAVSRDWVCLILTFRHTRKHSDPMNHGSLIPSDTSQACLEDLFSLLVEFVFVFQISLSSNFQPELYWIVISS